MNDADLRIFTFELSHLKSNNLILSTKLRSFTSLQDRKLLPTWGISLKQNVVVFFFPGKVAIQPGSTLKGSRPKAKSLVAPGREVSTVSFQSLLVIYPPGTNISLSKVAGKMMFFFHRWDMDSFPRGVKKPKVEDVSCVFLST